jgi:transposase InsO family protein
MRVLRLVPGAGVRWLRRCTQAGARRLAASAGRSTGHHRGWLAEDGRGAGTGAVDVQLVSATFTAEGSDGTWLTDIPEHPGAEGKLCRSAIKDVYSNRIACCCMDAPMTAALAVSALRTPARCAASRGSRNALWSGVTRSGPRSSSGRCASMAWPDRSAVPGSCRDNAAMESCFILH